MRTWIDGARRGVLFGFALLGIVSGPALRLVRDLGTAGEINKGAAVAVGGVAAGGVALKALWREAKPLTGMLDDAARGIHTAPAHVPVEALSRGAAGAIAHMTPRPMISALEGAGLQVRNGLGEVVSDGRLVSEGRSRLGRFLDDVDVDKLIEEKGPKAVKGTIKLLAKKAKEQRAGADRFSVDPCSGQTTVTYEFDGVSYRATTDAVDALFARAGFSGDPSVFDERAAGNRECVTPR